MHFDLVQFKRLLEYWFYNNDHKTRYKIFLIGICKGSHKKSIGENKSLNHFLLMSGQFLLNIMFFSPIFSKMINPSTYGFIPRCLVAILIQLFAQSTPNKINSSV